MIVVLLVMAGLLMANANPDDEHSVEKRQIVIGGPGFFNNTMGLLGRFAGAAMVLGAIALALPSGIASLLFAPAAFFGRSDDKNHWSLPGQGLEYQNLNI